MLEPIQSMAGVREATSEFFRELRHLCDDHGIILIFDEVQTGIGRTGEWFFGGSELADGIEPDIISLAKSLGSGVPVGSCLVNEASFFAHQGKRSWYDLWRWHVGNGGGRGNPEAIEDDGMIANARAVEQHLRDSLTGVKDITAIHGKGCLLGIEFDGPCGPMHKKLLENKIITGTSSDPKVLRLLPPLCVNTDEIDQLVEVLY